MAASTINYTINTTNGFDWTGSFAIADNSLTISASLPTDLTSSLGSNFVPAQFAAYGGSGTEYITWRSVDISGLSSGPPAFLNIYPSSGYSLDIWSADLWTYVTGGGTWTGLNGASYNLSTTKNTIHYDYASPNAEAFGSGGTISFTEIV